MEKLKPCPFCGGDVTRIETGFGVAQLVKCEQCKIMFVIPWSKATNGVELSRFWSRRADTVKTARCVTATDGSIICSECGMPFVMTGARFCPICGARLLDLIVTSEAPDGTEMAKIITEEQLRKSREAFESGQKTAFIPRIKTAGDNGKDVTQ